MSDFYSIYPANGGGSGAVTSVNGATGAITIVAGSGVTVTTVGGMITVAATGGAGNFIVDKFTLTPTDISNKFVTLSQTPATANLVILTAIGGPMQNYGPDYTVSGTQLGWSGLFLDGVLVSGDVLVVQYSS